MSLQQIYWEYNLLPGYIVPRHIPVLDRAQGRQPCTVLRGKVGESTRRTEDANKASKSLKDMG